MRFALTLWAQARAQHTFHHLCTKKEHLCLNSVFFNRLKTMITPCKAFTVYVLISQLLYYGTSPNRLWHTRIFHTSVMSKHLIHSPCRKYSLFTNCWSIQELKSVESMITVILYSYV